MYIHISVMESSTIQFIYLESVLGYLEGWRAQADATVGMRKEEKDRLCLSHQTDFGWHLTSMFL